MSAVAEALFEPPGAGSAERRVSQRLTPPVISAAAAKQSVTVARVRTFVAWELTSLELTSKLLRSSSKAELAESASTPVTAAPAANAPVSTQPGHGTG